MDTLLSLSKSATAFWLAVSEIALLIFGVVLVLGLVGEVARAARWKRRLRLFELMVIIGVAGELIADGGIFLFSRHLQTISESDFAVLNKRAADAYKEAGMREKDAANALERAAKAEGNLGYAKKDAALAEQHAAEANKKAEDERLARLKLEALLAPRRISGQQANVIQGQLSRLKKLDVILFVISGNFETEDFGLDIERVLKAAGLTVNVQRGLAFSGNHKGLDVEVGINRTADANVLGEAFKAAGVIPGPLPATLNEQQPDMLMLTVAPK